MHLSICWSAESTVMYCKNATSARFFLILVSVFQFSYSKSLHDWFSSMQHVGPVMGPNKKTLVQRCKEPLLSEITYDILTRADAKSLPKHWLFFRTGSRREVAPGRPRRPKSIVFKRILRGRKWGGDAWAKQMKEEFPCRRYFWVGHETRGLVAKMLNHFLCLCKERMIVFKSSVTALILAFDSS